MKYLPAQLLLAVAILFPMPLPGAEEPAAVLLRYTSTVSQTNAYSLEIQVQGESGKESLSGTYTVITRPVATNLIGISLRGQLRPKPGPMMPPMGYRPGSSAPLLASLSSPYLEGRELLVDTRGRILRQAGDLALPIPLGQLAASLLTSFPAEASSGWESEEEVFVLDEPLLQGPATAFLNPSSSGMGYMPSYYPGRSPQAVLAARQKIKVRAMEVTPETVTLQKTLSLDSVMLTGQEPRVSASGEGQIQLDRATGWPKRVEMQCKTVAVTETMSRRSMLSLKWQMLEGKEREAIVSPPPPPPPVATPTTLPSEDLAKLLQRLKTEDGGSREMAARELESQNSRLTATPELLAQMVSLLSSGNDTLRHAGLMVLASHGTKEHVPLLIKALSDSDASLRGAAAKGLGRLQDPRAVEPLVLLVAAGQADQPFYGRNRESAAGEALIRIGPPAEPAVLDLLKEKNIETRIQACSILKQIGTKKSLGPLKELTVCPSKELGEAAAEACRSIESRNAN
jgi:hypothetical protein